MAILSLFVLFSLGSIIFLIHNLLQMNSFLERSSGTVGSALVLQDLVLNLQNIESGARAYAITGDATFVEGYKESETKIKNDLRILKTTSELQLPDDTVEQIENLSNQKMEFMRSIITARDQEGQEAATALIATRQGYQIMRDLQREIDFINSASLKNIGPAQQRIKDGAHRAIFLSIAMSLFVLGTCGAVLWYFQRAILRERALDNTKSEFLSLASHQLRTPATNVKQYIGMLLEGYMGDLTDQQRHALTIAYKNNEAEISIMNNLLDVAKLDLNKIQIDRKEVNVAKLARQVVTDYKKKAAECDQTILMVGDTEAVATVDAGYIKGVIENLVDNSIKYSRPGATTTVKVMREHDAVLISVKDQGLGIRTRDFGKLFNKFARLDNEFSANSQGSGLGLYWVKQIVALHGGKIRLSSREGKGSTFKLYLPIR